MSDLDEVTIERIARAFWYRIEPHKNKYRKDLPKELPVEFRAHMATALGWLPDDRRYACDPIDNPDHDIDKYAEFLDWWRSVGEEYDNQHDAAFGGYCKAVKVCSPTMNALDRITELQEQVNEFSELAVQDAATIAVLETKLKLQEIRMKQLYES
jgi:hypothetical protein